MYNDPIHQVGEQYFFWDETEAERCGPYNTREQAEAALLAYVILLGE